jgi:hypothetical protein
MKERHFQILQTLNKDHVDINQLSKVCGQGIPDDIKGLI